MAQAKLRVAVVFGGKSTEHAVSLESARSVMAAMDPNRYEILPVGISPSGRWLAGGDPMKRLSEGHKGDDSGDLCSERPQASELATTDAGAHMRDLVPGASRGRFPQADVVFPVLHGTYGEDGTVQGLLELSGLPYVGAGVLGSALGLDKVLQKVVLRASGLPVVESLETLRKTWESQPDRFVRDVETRFSYPVFVKPANMGSSVGVSKARDRVSLRAALDLAVRYDRKVLVEEAVNAREIECSVLGNDEPIASVVGEVVPSNEFYDYRAKYVDNASELHIPADIPDSLANSIRAMAVQAFLAIDCAGMARVDFFLCRDSGRVYVNELNTIPGFTSISMYPKLWEASGVTYPELIDRLIDLALERHAEHTATDTTFGG